MTNHEADVAATKVLNALLIAKAHEKLAIFSLFATNGTTFEHFNPDEYSTGEKKRAIKFLRMAQSTNPDISQKCEDAIVFIRNNWLRKAV